MRAVPVTPRRDVYCMRAVPVTPRWRVKCLLQDSILPSMTKNGALLLGEFCSLHLLKVNSSARGLTFVLDGNGCSSSHPVCLIPGKEPLIPSEYDVWVSEQVWMVSRRENHLCTCWVLNFSTIVMWPVAWLCYRPWQQRVNVYHFHVTGILWPCSFIVEASWNVMAYAKKPDFVFWWNGQVRLNWRQFSDYWQPRCAH